MNIWLSWENYKHTCSTGNLIITLHEIYNPKFCRFTHFLVKFGLKNLPWFDIMKLCPTQQNLKRSGKINEMWKVARNLNLDTHHGFEKSVSKIKRQSFFLVDFYILHIIALKDLWMTLLWFKLVFNENSMWNSLMIINASLNDKRRVHLECVVDFVLTVKISYQNIW